MPCDKKAPVDCQHPRRKQKLTCVIQGTSRTAPGCDAHRGSMTDENSSQQQSTACGIESSDWSGSQLSGLRHLLLREARLITGSDEDAQDVVQDCIVRVLERAERQPMAANQRAWLRTMVRHRAIDVLRRKRPRSSVPPDELMAEAEPVSLGLSVDSAALQVALDALPGRAREVLELRYLRGLSYSQLATQLGLSESALGTRLHRARALLRAQLLT